MNSIGITMMFLAFALLLTWALSVEDFSRNKNIISLAIIRPLASIGIASYSIYLFHVPVKTIIDSIAMSERLKIPAYFIGCILVGKITWYLIERPIASYKSRFFSVEK
jgi:peptidoglycan/LPS O-acetylase OafA/YrhL